MKNPFEFGRELSPAELVDRAEEVAAVRQTLLDGGRLFVIGPRRFGKTSILAAAAAAARAEGAVVLRYNAEAYPTLTLLAQRLVADAAKQLTSSVQRAGKRVQEAFGALRPQLSYDPMSDTFAVGLAAAKGRAEEALFSETLDGLDRLAAGARQPVAVVIDEFQQIVEAGGVVAEGQVRAAVQTHAHVGYVFAGSKTSLLTAMTGDEGRPFYRLGSRLFVGPVPRDDFRPFLRAGFEEAGLAIEPDAVEALLDLAEEVPYNVQRLAHACWSAAREGTVPAPLSAATVADVLDRLVHRDDPFYTQAWNRLATTQQKALRALVEAGGEGLYASVLLGRYTLPLSTMRTALQGLVSAGIAREEETAGSLRYRLEDPFFAAWLRLTVPTP